MEVDYLKDEPKLILTYPYKSKVSIFCYLFMVISFVISMLILKYLISLRTDFSYMSIILIVPIYIPILLYLMVYPLFLNGVKLELYNEDIVKYYTYGSRGNSILHISFRLETVALLSKLDVDKHIDVEIKLDELDLTSAESKASYTQIKEYILEKFDLKVSTLYIAQIKKKCGIVLRENYNKSKKEKQVIPQCTPEKEEAIMDALRHFKMI